MARRRRIYYYNPIFDRCRGNVCERVHVEPDGTHRYVDDGVLLGFGWLLAGVVLVAVLWWVGAQFPEAFAGSSLRGGGLVLSASSVMITLGAVGVWHLRWRKELRVRDGEGVLRIRSPFSGAVEIDASDLVLALGHGQTRHGDVYEIIAHDRRGHFMVLAESKRRARSKEQFKALIEQTGLPASRRRVSIDLFEWLVWRLRGRR
jgi:hypothetical protein